MNSEFDMDTTFHGIAGDTAAGAIGAAVAAMTWLQIITGIEAVIAGALTIVLLYLRIRKHLKG